MHTRHTHFLYTSIMTPYQRLVLVISILASFLSFIDGSVVNVALPAIVNELGGGLSVQQWVTAAYLLTLGSLILIAGSLSDIIGRKRILTWGVIGFGITSMLCAVSPSADVLIISRALQGVFGALLVPSSLALIISTFRGSAQGKAIGTWTAWTGISFLIGPLVGGILVDTLSWRWIFIINIIPIFVILWLLRKLHSDKPEEKASVDIGGALLTTLGLGGIVYALIEQPRIGWHDPAVWLPLSLGVTMMLLFVWHERRIKQPMLPMSLFAVRNFSVGNIATIAIYSGLSVATFLITIFVQQVGGYSALFAGLSLLPITIIMFFLSSKFGELAGKYGPRLFMSVGPIVAACGFALFLMVDSRVDYLTQILPGVLVFGFGLSITVAPLTAAILNCIEPGRAGIASAINNAVSRIAGLVAIAGIALVTGDLLDVDGFHSGIRLTILLLVIGGIVSAIGITNDTLKQRESTT